METRKMVMLVVFGLVSTAIMILGIQIMIGKARDKMDESGNLRTGYAILFLSAFISSMLLLEKCIRSLSVTIDIAGKIAPIKVLPEMLTASAIFIGLMMVWLLVWYYITYTLCRMISGKRNETFELANNDVGYFLVRGGLLLGTVYSMSGIFDLLLQQFVPAIQTPFYH